MVSDAFTAGERQLLQALQIDGRAPFRVLAEVLGTSDQTVARRFARLRESGRARVVGLTAPLRLGLATWMVRVRTHPRRSARRRHPPSPAATTRRGCT
ncbi:MAG: AsnC family protein [Quadrisphaera sp.]